MDWMQSPEDVLDPNVLDRNRVDTNPTNTDPMITNQMDTNQMDANEPALGSGASTPTKNRAPDRPRLTDEEKRANHVASEQKRRQAIRAAFDRLTTIVPGTEGQGRSEVIMLRATGQYILEQVQKRQELLAMAKAKGLDVSGYELPDLPAYHTAASGARSSGQNPQQGHNPELDAEQGHDSELTPQKPAYQPRQGRPKTRSGQKRRRDQQ